MTAPHGLRPHPGPPPTLVDHGPALAEAGLVHRVRRPSPAPGAPVPAVVMLHGQGGDEDAMWVFAPAVPQGWLIVAPRAPVRLPEGGFAWLVRRPGEWPDLALFGPAVRAIDGFLTAMTSLYGADPGALHLMGFSQGAAAAFALALERPGRVRGVAGLVGFVPEAGEPEDWRHALAGLPVFVASGRRDRLVPADRAVADARWLADAGAGVDAHAYDVGHKLNRAAMRDLAAWWGDRAGQGAVSGAVPPPGV